MFPVQKTSDRLPPKTPVLGVWTKDAVRAYPISAFAERSGDDPFLVYTELMVSQDERAREIAEQFRIDALDGVD